jgi:hypothetical protein
MAVLRQQKSNSSGMTVVLLNTSGALKTLGANKDSPIPIQLFDISDVVLLDSATETVRGRCRNGPGIAPCMLPGPNELVA